MAAVRACPSGTRCHGGQATTLSSRRRLSNERADPSVSRRAHMFRRCDARSSTPTQWLTCGVAEDRPTATQSQSTSGCQRSSRRGQTQSYLQRRYNVADWHNVVVNWATLCVRCWVVRRVVRWVVRWVVRRVVRWVVRWRIRRVSLRGIQQCLRGRPLDPGPSRPCRRTGLQPMSG